MHEERNQNCCRIKRDKIKILTFKFSDFPSEKGECINIVNALFYLFFTLWVPIAINIQSSSTALEEKFLSLMNKLIAGNK